MVKRMGVYHICGLGTNPGALTMPLTTVYILQAAKMCGNEIAKDFFQYSGEMKREGRKGSREEHEGPPEGVIAFTSKGVIEGSVEIRYRSQWFGLFGNGKERIERPMRKYLKKFLIYLDGEFGTSFSDRNKIKYFYLVEVDHTDFRDCFKKIGITLRALRDKEIWANMVGGSNQINAAILVAGTYTAMVSRYYYLFQGKTDLMEPEDIEKPTKRNIKHIAEDLIGRWHELPLFKLELGELIRDIDGLFDGGRSIVNLKEIIYVLEKHGYTEQFIPKLRGKFLTIDGDRVQRTPYFHRVVRIWKEIDIEDAPSNFTEWKRWAYEQRILHEVEI